jgi:hypothetical protein
MENKQNMKNYNLNKKQWYRFSYLCKSFGFIVQTDATYTYSNLVETQHCYLRIIRNNEVVAIANLID